MSFNRNFLFKYLLPNFTEFKNNFEIYNTLENYNLTDTELEKCYKILFNNFANSTVKYDTPNAFYRHFYLKFVNYSEEFVAKLKLCQSLKNLTIKQLKDEITTITNVANNNNSIVESPLTEIIPYITTQSTSNSFTSDINAINKGINLYRDNQIYEYLNKFNTLFFDIFTNDLYFYE